MLTHDLALADVWTCPSCLKNYRRIHISRLAWTIWLRDMQIQHGKRHAKGK